MEEYLPRKVIVFRTPEYDELLRDGNNVYIDINDVKLELRSSDIIKWFLHLQERAIEACTVREKGLKKDIAIDKIKNMSFFYDKTEASRTNLNSLNSLRQQRLYIRPGRGEI